jgi:hypothetical protein
MKKIFFTYSDNAKDLELYKEFNKHFKTYARSGMLMIIDKEELFRINNDKEKALQFLNESDMTVPLLSIDYLNNDECLKMLESAMTANKTIIPVLLRECDYEGIEKIKSLEEHILPEDKQSVVEHSVKDGGQDEVFTTIAKKVKAAVFKELDTINIKTGPTLFYYVLSGIVFLIGILATIFSYTKWESLIMSAIIFLMFVVVALFPLKKALFPTKLSIS